MTLRQNQTQLQSLVRHTDIVIDPFRPGVLESFDFAPDTLCALNPRLIYARFTGHGQHGCMAQKAGHDINYLALSGALSTFQRKGQKPTPPVNYLADFAAGSFLCAQGIFLVLYEREQSGKGQVIDAAMVDGVNYLSTFLHKFQTTPMWNADTPGTNLLDSGAPFYDTYECSDGKFMAVGAIEYGFYQELLAGLHLLDKDEKLMSMDHMDPGGWEDMRNVFIGIFKKKTQKEWTEIFDQRDACVTPVLKLGEITEHRHNLERALVQDPGTTGVHQIASAPQ